MVDAAMHRASALGTQAGQFGMVSPGIGRYGRVILRLLDGGRQYILYGLVHPDLTRA